MFNVLFLMGEILMKLRILVKKYSEPTKEQCEALMSTDPRISTISQAYSKLCKSPTQDLQYCKELRNPINGEVTEYWENVPVVVEEVI